MSVWKDFVTVSLLGTEKGGTVPALPAALEKSLGPVEKLDREARFLTRAGALALWRKTGWKPDRARSATGHPAPVEPGAFVSSVSSAHLRAMLAGHNAEVLPEWLTEASRHQLRLPPESLPALLDWARQNRTRRPLVMAAGGARVRWLAARNAEWDFAADDAPEHWETGNRDQRLSILRVWRASDPAQARERLEAVWRTEPADTRAALLEVLADGLADDDIPFLERGLDDRSKEVRQQAVTLLSRLPNSPFVARMLARAEGLLVLKRGRLLGRAALEVNLPPDPDPAARRDGMDPKAFGEQLFGEKATLLVHILAAVPLRHWTDTFRLTPAELLWAAKKHEFANALFRGWDMAAIRQSDPAWAEAILDAAGAADVSTHHAHALAEVLPEAKRAARLVAGIRTGLFAMPYEWASWHKFTMALYSFKGHYPDDLAREIITTLRRLANDERGPTVHVWNAARYLMLSIPPALLPDAIQGWPTEKTYIALLVELLTFRRDALAALAQP